MKALLRIAALYNIPAACDRATADFLTSSPLILEEHDRDRAARSHVAAPPPRGSRTPATPKELP